MPKRYRTQPYRPGILRAYWGIAGQGENPCLVANGLKSDCAVLLDAWEKGKAKIDHIRGTFNGFDPSFLEALEERGFDLTTIKFSIKKKQDVQRDT